MSLTSIDLRTLSAVLVEVDSAMEFCGISRFTRDAVRAATMEKIVSLTLKGGDLSKLPELMVEAAPHVVGHPSRTFQE